MASLDRHIDDDDDTLTTARAGSDLSLQDPTSEILTIKLSKNPSFVAKNRKKTPFTFTFYFH